MTSSGHPTAIFKRALQRGNLTVAEAVSKELPPLNLADALELTILIARKDPRRQPRVAARRLLRYLEDCPEVTIDEAAMVAACLTRSPATATRTRPCRFEPWPKEPLVEGGLEARARPSPRRRAMIGSRW